MSNKLFVGNLSFNTTENDLQDAFAAYGTVTETNLMMDRHHRPSARFWFRHHEHAPKKRKKPLTALNGAQLDGRALTVNVAKPREERAARRRRRRSS